MERGTIYHHSWRLQFPHIPLLTLLTCGSIFLLVLAFVQGMQIAISLHLLHRTLMLFIEALPSIFLFSGLAARSIWHAYVTYR